MENIVIIGAGQAGARAAFALRDKGWSGRIIMLGKESLAPYERPPLSKEVLLGQATPTDGLIASLGDYEQADVELLADTHAVRIDPEARIVITHDGRQFPYSHAIFATGARARPLQVPGAQLRGVYTLRDAHDAAALQHALRSAANVAIVGGGLVGLEIAAAVRKLGLPVVVLEQGPNCLARILPPLAAKPIIASHMAQGVSILCNQAIESLEGDEDGRVRSLHLQDGTLVKADVVVVGIGSIANDELARSAGIECDNGIVVDGQCRASMADIYAIGDVASQRDAVSGRALRLESWENAERQGAAVAATILGNTPDADDTAPWFWTDQYDMNVQILGMPTKSDLSVVRQGESANQFVQFYLAGSTLVGAVMFNSGRDRRALAKMIGRSYAAADLENSQLPLRQLSGR